jgi:hypothetical protein
MDYFLPDSHSITCKQKTLKVFTFRAHTHTLWRRQSIAPCNATFSHPDCNRRLRSHTESCASSALAGYTADREFHPAPKVSDSFVVMMIITLFPSTG